MLTILFICGSLQRGSDGVGDYTRQLACELIRQGHKVNAIALQDIYVKESCFETQVDDQGTEISVLRIPSMRVFKKESSMVTAWVRKLDPQWLSLQFVPFAFQKKGLIINVAEQLQVLGQGRRWHMMFHELWVGMNFEASVKLSIWGMIQKRLIKDLIIKLNPQVIHTQAKVYQSFLNDLGVKAGYLPLISNISPIREVTGPTIQSVNDRIRDKFNLVIFGTIHAGAPVLQFAKEVAEYSRQRSVLTSLKILGRCGPEKEYWTSVFYSEGLSVDILGEQPSAFISNELINADLGITSTPLLLVEKSGTVAAMHAHGLPVLCVAKSWTPRTKHLIPHPDNIMYYQQGNFNACVHMKNSYVNNILGVVSMNFLNALSDHVNSGKLVYLNA